MCSSTFLQEGTRVSRRQRPCDECHTPIEKGERYHYYAGKFEGDFCDHAAHESCWYFLMEYAAQDDGCWISGTMLYGMHESGARPGLFAVGEIEEERTWNGERWEL